MMKKILLFAVSLLFLSHVPGMAEDEPHLSSELLDEVKISALRPFFNALRNGDVRQIERYISGNKSQETQLPQHEDKEYREFLREYYKDAIFSVEQAVYSESQIIVDVKIEFPGRGWKLTQFYLQQQDLDEEIQGRAIASGRRWSIVEQRHDRDKSR